MKTKFSLVAIAVVATILVVLFLTYYGPVRSSESASLSQVRGDQNTDFQKNLVTQKLALMPLSFTENQGQFGEKTLFKAEAGGASFFFSKDEVAYLFIRDTDELIEEDFGAFDGMSDISDAFKEHSYKKEGLVIKVKFIGANPNPEVRGEKPLTHNNNYFLGNDPSRWRTNVPNYSAVVYKNIYNGIDLKYYGDGSSIKYDFIVQPQADISQIKIRYEGVEGLNVSPDGDLEIQTSFGLIFEKAPQAYQIIRGEKKALTGRYELIEPKVFTFAIDAGYDPSYPLVIDPTLIYSSYLGGSNKDWGFDIAVDWAGFVYVTGYTWSSNFDTFNAIFGPAGDRDVFVIKLSGGVPVYSTYLGGEDDDWGFGIASDTFFCAYVTGYTKSEGFPTTNNAYQSDFNGEADVFVTKLWIWGDSLVYSTYLGGSKYEAGHAIDVHQQCAYVTGITYSTDFDVTSGSYQENNKGYWDVFVSKFNNLGELDRSTYLGGLYIETGEGIAVDENGVYVTGWTWSDNFPTTGGTYDSTFNGSKDVFVTKLNNDLSSLHYSTYLGGDSADYGKGIAVDGSGCAYVTGRTWSADFNTAGNPPYQGSKNDSCDVFVTKLNAYGNGLDYSTYLGGDSVDYGNDIAMDNSGCAYVTGWTKSPNFLCSNAPDCNFDGPTEVFVTKFDANGLPVYSTFLGGEGPDYGQAIAVYNLGLVITVCVTGMTGGNFPTTPNAWEDNYGTNYDAFVSIFLEGGNLPPTAVIDSITPNPAPAGYTVFFGGHGNDIDGSIVGYKWWSNWDGQLSTSSEFSSSILTPHLHTIYFKVYDDYGDSSVEVFEYLLIEGGGGNPQSSSFDIMKPDHSRKNGIVVFDGSVDAVDRAYGKGELGPDSLSEEWQVSWWYTPPDSTPWFKTKMHDSYKCTLLTTNITQTGQVFNLGLYRSVQPQTYLGTGWSSAPDWFEERSTCLLNGQQYDFDTDATDAVGSDDTEEYIFRVSNDWQWIEPWNWKRLVLIAISCVPGSDQTAKMKDLKQYTKALKYWDAIKTMNTINGVASTGFAVPRVKYTYTGSTDTGDTSLGTAYIYVRPAKIIEYFAGFFLGVAASKATTKGWAAFFASGGTLSTAAVGYFILEAILYIASEVLYIMSDDPDSNYTEMIYPEKRDWEDSIYDDYDVQGSSRTIGETSFDLFYIAEAGQKSYAKYLGALKDDSTEWATMQLAATRAYMRRLSCLSQELEKLVKNPVSDPYVLGVDTIKGLLRDSGLPDVEVAIMDSLVPDNDTTYNPDTIAACFLDAYNYIPNFQSTYSDLDTSISYLHSSLQTLVCSLLLDVPSGAKVCDLETYPSLVKPGETIDNLKCWVEFPGVDYDSLLGYQFESVMLSLESDTFYWPNIDTNLSDHDGDGVFERLMTFYSVDLSFPEAGQQLLCVTGNVIIPSGVTFFDTLFFTGATVFTVSKCGDVNCDTCVNLSDVICLVLNLFGKPCSIDFELSDVDCNNLINLTDVLLIAHYYFGVVQNLDCCACQ